MAIETESAGRLLPRVGLETLRRRWGWYLALGVALIALGAFAIGHSVTMTAVAVLTFGWVLIIGGVLEAVHAFWRKGWGGFFLDLAVGILYFVVGFMIVANPAASAVALTLLVAMFLIVGGIFRGVMAVAVRYPNWIWMLLHGIVSLLLGVLIWQRWPIAGLWVIGLYIGIEMIFNGSSLVMLGLAARKLPSTESREAERHEMRPPPGREQPAPAAE
jgi:uncharacterized membrane protein HdeD (DUF308 family)